MFVSWLGTWINAFLKPKETFAREKQNASYKKAFINLIIAGVIWGIFFVGYMVPLENLFLIILSLGKLDFTGIINLILLILIGTIFFVIIELTNSIVIFIFAKILGGQGKFEQLLYLFSLFFIPWAIVGGLLLFPLMGESATTSFNLIAFIMIFLIGWKNSPISPMSVIFLILNCLLAIYIIWLTALSVKEAMNLSKRKAIIASVPTVIFSILVIFIILALILLTLVVLGGMFR